MKPKLTRRAFFRTGTAAMAVAAVAPSLLQAAPKRDFRKAIMLDTLGFKGTLEERFKAMKETGFEGVEPLSHMNQDEVVKALESSGLKAASVCCATHWKDTLSDPDPAVRARGLEGLRQALRDAKRYGATSVLLVPGVVNDKVSYDQCWDRSTLEIRRAVPLAEELGVRIAIENVWNDFLLSPLEAARYVDQFNSPMVGWHFDCGNIIHYGWPEQWIRILGKRLSRIHIKEFSRKKADAQGRWKGFDVPLLEGDNNWAAIMKALDDVGYAGWLISEMDGSQTRDLPSLKEFSARMDRIIAS